MAYFVTGATGFIGRFLMAELLEREGTIYVLCRASSLDKLDELRTRLGTDEKRVVAVIGDLAKERLGVDAGRDRQARRRRSSTSSTWPRSTT